MTTFQSINRESPEFCKFLRKAAKQGDWRARASDGTKWCLEFRRTIKGAVGEPDQDIEVQTDVFVGMSGKFGMSQAFSDSKPVMIRKPGSLYLGETDSSTICQLLLKFPTLRFNVSCSAGSTHSSQYGLSFYHLDAYDRSLGLEVQIGGTSVCNGEVLVSSAVSFF